MKVTPQWKLVMSFEQGAIVYSF